MEKTGKLVLNRSFQISTLLVLLIPSFLSAGNSSLKTNSSQTNSFQNPIIIILIALVIVQFIIIVFLLVKRKDKRILSNKELDDELRNLAHAYLTLKRSYKKLKELNENNQSKIKDFKRSISELETVNIKLLEKKQKLEESKMQLEELQKKKERLFAIAVHDIKNPIAAIKGYIELIKSYDLNAQEQQEIIESLVETSNKVISLAQEMSEAIANDEPEKKIVMEKSSLKEIIDSVCLMNSAYARKKNIKIINKSSSSMPDIEINKSKIEEAIENLINNAIKYGPSGTEVHVVTFFNNEFVTVEIIDNGVGLSEEDQVKVFTKGAVLSSKPTGNETRSGLGLWIVKQIIEEHKGKVWVKSKLGSGSTFAFELPITD